MWKTTPSEAILPSKTICFRSEESPRIKGRTKPSRLQKKTGSRLILAGNVQNKEKDRVFFKNLKKSIDLVTDAGKPFTGRDYYEKVMKPILDSDKQIIYIGEVDSNQKKLWYKHARATLFPI